MNIVQIINTSPTSLDGNLETESSQKPRRVQEPGRQRSGANRVPDKSVCSTPKSAVGLMH